jgi:hypothetical protein
MYQISDYDPVRRKLGNIHVLNAYSVIHYIVSRETMITDLRNISYPHLYTSSYFIHIECG